MDPDVFDLVYEGFWDLYTFHPMCGDVSAKKLQQWIQKINLITPEVPEEPAAAEEEDPAADEDAEEVKEDPLCALVRIRIPKQEPAPEYDDDGNVKEIEYDEAELDEIPFDDRAISIPNNVNNQKIWQINQIGQRTLRQDFATEFKRYIDRLEGIDLDDFNFRMEKEAVRFEDAFLKLFQEGNQNSTAPALPVFDYSPEH